MNPVVKKARRNSLGANERAIFVAHLLCRLVSTVWKRNIWADQKWHIRHLPPKYRESDYHDKILSLLDDDHQHCSTFREKKNFRIGLNG